MCGFKRHETNLKRHIFTCTYQNRKEWMLNDFGTIYFIPIAPRAVSTASNDIFLQSTSHKSVPNSRGLRLFIGDSKTSHLRLRLGLGLLELPTGVVQNVESSVTDVSRVIKKKRQTNN